MNTYTILRYTCTPRSRFPFALPLQVSSDPLCKGDGVFCQFICGYGQFDLVLVPSNVLFVQFFVDHQPTNNLGFFLTYRHVENSLLHVMTTAANIRTNTSYSRTVSPAANL